MAKSLGNFITIKDFIDKYKNVDLLKLFFLSTHYSHPIDYTVEKIEEAKKQNKSFEDFFDNVNNWQKVKSASSEKDKAKIDTICTKFQEALDDNFNTPEGLACLFELIDLGSGFVSSDKEEAFNYAKSKLEVFFDIFGLKVKPRKKIPAEMLKMISEREKARKNKDFKRADTIREELKTKFKLIVSDTGSSVTFTEI